MFIMEFSAEDTTFPDRLQEAQMDILKNEECKTSWSEFLISDNHMCAGQGTPNMCAVSIGHSFPVHIQINRVVCYIVYS